MVEEEMEESLQHAAELCSIAGPWGQWKEPGPGQGNVLLEMWHLCPLSNSEEVL